MKSSREILAEVRLLREMIPVGPNAAGTRHKIELTIEELVDGVDTSSDEWAEMNCSEHDVVYAARNWKNGWAEQRPSEGWEGLVE